MMKWLVALLLLLVPGAYAQVCFGAQSGCPDITNSVRDTVVSATTGTGYSVDLRSGGTWFLTVTSNTTISLTNPPPNGISKVATLYILQDPVGAWTVNLPGAKWSNGVSPSLGTTSNTLNVLNYMTLDGGATYYGFQSGVDMR